MTIFYNNPSKINTPSNATLTHSQPSNFKPNSQPIPANRLARKHIPIFSLILIHLNLYMFVHISHISYLDPPFSWCSNSSRSGISTTIKTTSPNLLYYNDYWCNDDNVFNFMGKRRVLSKIFIYFYSFYIIYILNLALSFGSFIIVFNGRSTCSNGKIMIRSQSMLSPPLLMISINPLWMPANIPPELQPSSLFIRTKLN